MQIGSAACSQALEREGITLARPRQCLGAAQVQKYKIEIIHFDYLNIYELNEQKSDSY